MTDCTFDTVTTDFDPCTCDTGMESFDTAASMAILVDFDGDGHAETAVSDLDGDGVADVYDSIDPYTGLQVIAVDTDADGFVDVAVIDADGDGTFEQGLVDTDGDGFLETTVDPADLVDAETDAATDTVEPVLPEVDTLETESELSEDVHGEPMAEIPYHQAQVGPNDCLPTSVAMVLTEITGAEVPQAELVDLANELGLLGPDGMAMGDGVVLLEHYGVDAEVTTGTMDELRTMLDNGTEVIIGLDADDLYGEGDAPFADDFVSGHAVVITGIDDEAGLVYINDPGLPDGAGVAVPIADFEDAWADGDNVMVTVDADATTEAPATDETTVETRAAAEALTDGEGGIDLVDLVLLPLTLILR